MKNPKLLDILSDAEKTGSYLITATIRDKEKEEGNLTHHHVRQDFPLDDIIPSLDHSVRTMKIQPKIDAIAINPEPFGEEKRKDLKPLKIAIITHFKRCPDSYSPGKAVKNQIKLLQKYGHEVVFFVQEGSTLDVGCELRPVVPNFKREKNVINEEMKNKFIDVLRENLTDDFDVAITHDFYLDSCVTYREAVRECGVKIPWLHWARSGVGRKIDFNMDNAKYVYMNYQDSELFASRISVDIKDLRVVFNEKDPSLMFDWDPITKMISDKMELQYKDIIQTYPLCTTRMDAKGINSVIATFGKLKEAGKDVALIICNSNGRKRLGEIETKMNYAKTCGLTEQDIVFTSTLANDEFKIESEVPHRIVSELFHISNLFIFPTIAEVCSNVLLEASMTKNLIVINEDLPSLFDFVNEDAVLKHPFTSLRSMHYSGRDGEAWTKLSKQIIGQIDSNKADKQFRKVWSTHNLETVYYDQLAPILYERS